VGLGLVLDRWFGTTPWLLIVGFFLGSAAALRNVMRTAQQLEAERKRAKAEERRDPS
jgi:ATP synthase protein I